MDHISRRQFKDALPILCAVAAQNDDDVEAWVSIVQALSNTAAPADEWHVAIDRALELDPTNAITHYSLGLLLDGRNDYAGAEREYRETIRLDPNSSMVHFHLGLLLKKHRNDDAGAEQEYREAIRLDPNNQAARHTLDLLLSKKDSAGAEREFREAIKLDPNNALAHYNLVTLLKDRQAQRVLTA